MLVSSSADKSISDDTTLSDLLDSGDAGAAGLFRFDIPILLLRLRGGTRPPRDCLPPALRLLLTLFSDASSSLLRSADLARANGADSRRLLLDPVEERDPLRLTLALVLPPLQSSSSPSSYDKVGRTAAASSSWILTSGDMIATLSAGMVDSPLLPVRDGILDGPGTLE